ncbi:hypothetical protein V6N11_058516 [Hibiscus sabdariffa]|uniref:Uncharacterized protein n=1 Tax=Hibiscus sabdariffa TaxID=183260 RepID=A0ABR2U4K2_9ROSI
MVFRKVNLDPLLDAKDIEESLGGSRQAVVDTRKSFVGSRLPGRQGCGSKDNQRCDCPPVVGETTTRAEGGVAPTRG